LDVPAAAEAPRRHNLSLNKPNALSESLRLCAAQIQLNLKPRENRAPRR
jgi:hypothetical protein